MKNPRKIIVRAIIASVVGGAALMMNGSAPFISDNLISTASAAIGRPLTPLSYAGVARRTTRRAVRRGAAVGAATRSRCVQVTDAYGRIYTRCD
jgi:hypothetical protein